MIRPRVAAYSLLILLALALLWPREAADDTAALREVGYKAARSAIYHRQLAAVALDSLVSARFQTDLLRGRARARVTRTSATAFTDLPVRVDTLVPWPIMGQPFPTDTMVPLRLARLKVQDVVDTANAVLMSLDAMLLMERQRADSVIRSLQRTVAAQDTVAVSLAAQLKAKSPPWNLRARRSVEDAALAAVCGGTGYVAFGPVGLVAAPVCAAVNGIRRR